MSSTRRQYEPHRIPPSSEAKDGGLQGGVEEAFLGCRLNHWNPQRLPISLAVVPRWWRISKESTRLPAFVEWDSVKAFGPGPRWDVALLSGVAALKGKIQGAFQETAPAPLSSWMFAAIRVVSRSPTD